MKLPNGIRTSLERNPRPVCQKSRLLNEQPDAGGCRNHAGEERFSAEVVFGKASIAEKPANFVAYIYV